MKGREWQGGTALAEESERKRSVEGRESSLRYTNSSHQAHTLQIRLPNVDSLIYCRLQEGSLYIHVIQSDSGHLNASSSSGRQDSQIGQYNPDCPGR